MLTLAEADKNARLFVMPKNDWFRITKILTLSLYSTLGVNVVFPRGLVLFFGAWLGGVLWGQRDLNDARYLIQIKISKIMI